MALDYDTDLLERVFWTREINLGLPGEFGTLPVRVEVNLAYDEDEDLVLSLPRWPYEPKSSVNARLLADQFAYNVREHVDLLDLVLINRRNANERSSAICHSHDFTDANVWMHEAGISLGFFDADVEAHFTDNAALRLWAEAWKLTKYRNFYSFMGLFLSWPIEEWMQYGWLVFANGEKKQASTATKQQMQVALDEFMERR